MSYARALLALSLPALACAALAPGAFAREGGETHQFTGTVTSEVSAVGSQSQEFDFGTLMIKCKASKPFKGTPETAFPAQKIEVLVKVQKCKTLPVKVSGEELPAAKATFNEPLEIEYHASGEANAEIVNASKITITIEAFECTVSWAPSVAVTEHALYEDAEVKAKSLKRFPTGVQDVVRISNGVKRIAWSATGGACGKLKKHEGKEGEYFGTLFAELKSGNMGWE